MIRRLLGISALLVVVLGAAEAFAQCPAYIQRNYPWHGAYYDPAWGAPVALVVPPTATLQTKWSWGVTNTKVMAIGHQFGRGYPGPYYGGPYGFMPTPPIPGATDQFGVYYVRGPW